MWEGVHWRGNRQAQRNNGQQEANPNQNFVLQSRPQGRRRAANFLILCLGACLLSWTISRTSRVLLPISTERLRHQEPSSQGIVFQLFRYYRYSQARNRSLIPVHRRRIGLVLDEDGADEHEGQGIEYDESLEKRRRPKVAPQNPPHAALGRWPMLGGLRESDVDIQPFYVKVPIGSGEKLREYFMHIDTGSGVSWIMCEGRGPITMVGPNGLFAPKTSNFLNCKKKEELCKAFQDGVEHPCDRKHKFRCIFDQEYGDGLTIEGHIVVEDVCFEARDGSHVHVHIAFGCADMVDEESTMREGQTTAPTDGLIGLGPHPASWLHQFNQLGLISEHVIALCFEPALGRRNPAPGPQLPEPAGFLSFGNFYSAQSAHTIWTPNIPSNSESTEAMYTGRLVGIKYRKTILVLKERRGRKKDTGVLMGFDTGSDLTYLTKKTFNAFLRVNAAK